MEDKVVVGGYPGLLEGAYVQLAARRVESGLAGPVIGDEGPRSGGMALYFDTEPSGGAGK